ncbi:MAG TPA: L,D-transpeptidase [Polyangiaceae bacterium]
MFLRRSHVLIVLFLSCVSLSACRSNRREEIDAARRQSSSPAATGSAPATSARPRAPEQTSVATPSAEASVERIADDVEQDPSAAARWQTAALARRTQPSDAPRLYAKTRHVWIYADADSTKQWIGFLWSGGSVKLRDTKPRYGLGCDQFYAVEPRGYICADPRRVTTDPADPVVAALYPYSPRADSPWPHRYGESRGTPIYFSLPDESEQRNHEPDLRRQLERIEAARAQPVTDGPLVGVDLTPSPVQALTFPRLAASVHEAHSMLKTRSTVAYSAEVRHAGRDFLLTSDYRFVPKDRVAPYPVSRFHGLRLGVDAQLPLAFFRTHAVPRYRRTESGEFVAQGSSFERLNHVELTGKSQRQLGKDYVETKTGDWIERALAVVPTTAEKTPWDAIVGKPDSSPIKPKGRATWIEVSIRSGWLIAYEDTMPVFVTLISPGRGGEATAGRDPLETSATPTGRFSITGKFLTSTMVAPNDYFHSDVPYAQNFTGPYALHSAYWHDNWGNLMSGGCINLSPIDAEFMFRWTEPPAPPGWHGTRWLPYFEPATTLIIHR